MAVVSRAWAPLAAMALLAGELAAAHAAGRRLSSCAFVPNRSAPVASVEDGRTLRLADGTEVRLAGLAALETSGASTGDAGLAAAEAKAALARRAAGKTLALHALYQDRYGREVVLAALANNPASLLQRDLLAGGDAVAAARIDPPGCASMFRNAEHTARAARLGLWRNPYYLVRRADQPAAVSAARGRFALVEGQVLSVRERGATIFVNFGRRWSQDFTVTIAKRNAAKFVAAGLEPKSLAGRRILVRGWVDERGGPWIEASRPEQIEFAN